MMILLEFEYADFMILVFFEYADFMIFLEFVYADFMIFLVFLFVDSERISSVLMDCECTHFIERIHFIVFLDFEVCVQASFDK